MSALSEYQPLKAWPALVGFAGFVAFAPALTDWALTAEPPLELNVTVKLFACHLAYSVALAVTLALKS